MDPLAAYLLSIIRNEKTNDTRTFQRCEEALAELGYWLMERPTTHPREKMPKCAITEECKLVDSFNTYNPPFCGYDGFDLTIDVYADPNDIDTVNI